MKLLCALVIAAGLSSACAAPTAAAPAPVFRHPIEQYLEFAPGADDWVRTELYFGFSHNGQVVVSEDAWKEFLKAEVTPRFPDGFTVIPARGQWQNGKGIVELEETRVLVLFTPPSPDANTKIDAIRAAFLKKFSEDSVLRVTSPSKVAF